ncbi:MAG: NAD(P)/FAD-dependent oxidoreductase [Pseudomonadales bacterium]
MQTKRKVVVVGGGFAGIALARSLDTHQFTATLIDQNNYHLFQPLLYQVATGSMSATDIAAPLRMIIKPATARVVQEQVIGVDRQFKRVLTASGHVYPWDILVLATGLGHSYFGHDEWAEFAPSLKYLEDAFSIRDRILQALEAAETCQRDDERKPLLHFAVVGGGPTGVEIAGAIGELTGRTLAREFHSFDPRSATIDLLEAGPRILPTYTKSAATEAESRLKKLGVTVLTQTKVLAVDGRGVLMADAAKSERRIAAANIIWAAGASATPLSQTICQQLGITTERGGRVKVDEHFTVPGQSDVFVVGDLAHYELNDKPLPGLAPAAEQAGRYVGDYLNGRPGSFHYRDRGTLAVIGRNAAVGTVLGRSVTGPIAWWLWLFVHIRELVGFDVKLKVTVEWAWKFLFDKYGARIAARRRPKSS